METKRGRGRPRIDGRPSLAPKSLFNKTKNAVLTPAELVELRTRQSALLLKLDDALVSQDIESIYWINSEIMTICHIFGIASPMNNTIGTEVLRGLREMRALALPEGTPTNSAEAMRNLLTAALHDAAKISKDNKEE